MTQLIQCINSLKEAVLYLTTANVLLRNENERLRYQLAAAEQFGKVTWYKAE